MVVGNLPESSEVVIIGAGPGGYVAAIRLAQLGKEVTVISNDPAPGGVCLLRGCIPSKALIEVTRLLEKIPAAAEMGIHVEGLRLEPGELQDWKEKTIQKLTSGIKQLFKNYKIQWIQGEARFHDAHSLKIKTAEGEKSLNFKQAIIATGSRPRELPGFPVDGAQILTSREALSLREAPKHLLIIGGGYIGLELAGVYRKMGSEITVVEATEQLMPGLDKDLLRPLNKNLKKQGLDIHLKTTAEITSQNAEGISIQAKNETGETWEKTFSHVLVSIGRVPNGENLNIGAAGLELNERGFVPINEFCQTAQKHIYAIGDVAGGMMLAHKASREGKIAAAHIAGEQDAWDNQVPAVVFTDPEIAYVGLQESQAIEKGFEIKTGLFPFAALGRAQTMNETEGMVKVVAEKSTDRLLGVQMVGPHVSDLIAEATLALEMGATAHDLSLTIHAHPTLPEAIEEACEAIEGMSIHRFQRR